MSTNQNQSKKKRRLELFGILRKKTDHLIQAMLRGFMLLSTIIYMADSISFLTFLYRHFNLSSTLENSVSYCNTLDGWTVFYDFRLKSTATAAIGINPTLVNFKNEILHFRRTICNKILISTWKKCHRNVWNASDCFSTVLHELSISFWVA